MYVIDLSTNTGVIGPSPVSTEHCSLILSEPVPITSITVSKGREKTVSIALKQARNLTFPAANRVTRNANAYCVWIGPAQALLVGHSLSSLKDAALTDQSDGWVEIILQGAQARAVLARLVPIDLRSHVFKLGHAARTLLFHVPLSINRRGKDSFTLLVYRSMVDTAVHELGDAMKSVAAQSA